MRRISYVALCMWGLCGLLSCGGDGTSSSLEKNEFLGEVPSIMQTYQRTDSLLEVEKEKKLESTKDFEKLMKYGEEREKKKEAAAKKRDEGIAKEKEKLVGKVLPVEYDGITQYEVTDLKITDLGDRGDFTVTGKVKLKETVRLIGGIYRLSCELRDAQNQLIEKNSTSISTQAFGQREMEAGGEYDATLYILAGKNPGLSRFAKVVFVPEEDR